MDFWAAGQYQALKGPLSSRGGETLGLSSRVTSALKRGVSQTHCRPRPELDIDLTPAYLSPGNSEAGGLEPGPLVDGSGQTKIVPLGASLSYSF